MKSLHQEQNTDERTVYFIDPQDQDIAVTEALTGMPLDSIVCILPARVDSSDPLRQRGVICARWRPH